MAGAGSGGRDPRGFVPFNRVAGCDYGRGYLGMTQRTRPQQNAIEVFCKALAEALNDAGYEMKAVMAVKTADVPWNQERVKDLLWRPIQEAMYNETSTTKLETNQVSRVHQVLDRHIASNFGISISFPSRESQWPDA